MCAWHILDLAIRMETEGGPVTERGDQEKPLVQEKFYSQMIQGRSLELVNHSLTQIC